MRVRSLPHFAHAPIGKSTHTKRFSYKHMVYITREEACAKTLASNMPNDPDLARLYFQHQAFKDGVADNARVADTLIIALPIELTKEQRYEAIEAYMKKIGKDRIAWFAAFHELGKDEKNPHCHLIFRDADIETGRKVVGTTTSSKDVKEAQDKGWRVPPRMTTKDLRVAWCDHLNLETKRHGLDVQFDQRRLKDRGIDRDAEIHLGRKGHAMAKANKEFESKDRRHGNHVTAYSLLDTGSRSDHNERIRIANQNRKNGVNGFAAEPEKLRQREELRQRQAEQRRVLYQEQKCDRQALREAHDAEKLAHQRWGRALYAKAREKAYQKINVAYQAKWKEVRAIPNRDVRDRAADGLKAEQKKTYADTAKAEVDAVRPEKNAAWQTLKATQDTERQALKKRHIDELSALSRHQTAERYALQERWQQTNLNRQASQVSAKLETRQSMPIVQANAVAMIKLRAKQARPAYNGSEEAVQYFTKTASLEAEKLNAIRYQLTADRQANQIRAAVSPLQRTEAGQIVEGRAANRNEAAAQRQAREQSDKRHAVQRAVANGETLSTSDRANASPEIAAAASAKEKSNRMSRDEIFLASFKNQQSGKSRDGGRSGR